MPLEIEEKKEQHKRFREKKTQRALTYEEMFNLTHNSINAHENYSEMMLFTYQTSQQQVRGENLFMCFG